MISITKMKRKMTRKLLLSISLFTTGLCFAAPLTPEEALNRLDDNRLGMGTRGSVSLQPVMIKTTELGEPSLYVFDSQETPGFMVVSADDAVVPLLGYSDFNSFDPDNISPAMENWLNQYSRQIEYVRANNLGGNTEFNTRISLPGWSAIAPLVKTTWNQGAPYNNKCPLQNGVRTYTGCVATAMSQVMNYFKYPEKGQGEITYDSPYTGKLTLNFGSLTFDWNNMLNSYNGTSNPAVNQDAVATLMMAAGYSVQMSYSTNQSGAISGYIPGALVKYFNYDKGVTYVARSQKNYTEWATLIYNNLKNVGPIIYDGDTATSGGHSFVCDGYNGNGYFHFNWGWGGAGDGYFLLDSLDPSSIGIGGAIGGFDFRQDIIVNIQKPKSGSQTEQSEIFLSGSAEGYSSSNFLYYKIYGAQYPGYRYLGTSSLTFDIGISVVPADNPTSTPKYVVCSNNATFQRYDMPLDPGFVIYTSGESGYPYPMYTLSSLGLSDGVKYKITGAYKPQGGDWKEVASGSGCYNYFYITKNGNSYNFENFPQMQFTCDKLALDTELYYTKAVEVSMTLANQTSTELTRSAILVLLDAKDNIEFMGDSFVESLSPGEKINKTYTTALSKLSQSQFTKATPYYLGLYDLDTQTIYYKSAQQVTMQVDPGAAQYTMDFSITNGKLMDPPEYNIDVYYVDNAQDIETSLKINVTKGIFSSDIVISGGKVDVNTGYATLNMTYPLDLQIINAGESWVYDQTINFSNAIVDELYILIPFVDGAQQTGIGFIAARNESGVTQISGVDNDILMVYDKIRGKLIANGATSIDVYSLNGVKLSSQVSYNGEGVEADLSNLGKGIVVVTAIDNKGNSKTIKLAL